MCGLKPLSLSYQVVGTFLWFLTVDGEGGLSVIGITFRPLSPQQQALVDSTNWETTSRNYTYAGKTSDSLLLLKENVATLLASLSQLASVHPETSFAPNPSVIQFRVYSISHSTR